MYLILGLNLLPESNEIQDFKLDSNGDSTTT